MTEGLKNRRMIVSKDLYSPSLPYPTASRDVAPKSKQEQRQFNRKALTSCPKGGEVKKTKRDNVKRFFRTLRLYFLTETPREKRLNPVTTAAGIFQPLRHYVPPPLYFALQNTEEEGVGVQHFGFTVVFTPSFFYGYFPYRQGED